MWVASLQSRLPTAANLVWVGWQVGRNHYYYYEERNETEAALIKKPPFCPGGDPWHLHMQPVPAGVARWPVGIPSPDCCQSGPAAPAGLLGSWAPGLSATVNLSSPGGLAAWGSASECYLFRLGPATCTPPISLFHSSLINPTPSRLLFASCLFHILSCTQPFPPIERPPIASTSSLSPFSTQDQNTFSKMAELRRKLVIVGDGACGKTCLLM